MVSQLSAFLLLAAATITNSLTLRLTSVNVRMLPSSASQALTGIPKAVNACATTMATPVVRTSTGTLKGVPANATRILRRQRHVEQILHTIGTLRIARVNATLILVLVHLLSRSQMISGIGIGLLISAHGTAVQNQTILTVDPTSTGT